MTRTRLLLVSFGVIAAAILAAILWTLSDSPAPTANVSGEAAIGGPFRLVDQFGDTRTPAAFRGHYMLVYFGYTNCPDVCPTTLQMEADALAKLGVRADQVIPVFITVDPARDTPKILKDYLNSFGPRFVGLTGSPKAIAAAAHAYRVYYERHPLKGGGYSMDHSNWIYLMDKNGKFLANYNETLGANGLATVLENQLKT